MDSFTTHVIHITPPFGTYISVVFTREIYIPVSTLMGNTLIKDKNKNLLDGAHCKKNYRDNQEQGKIVL